MHCSVLVTLQTHNVGCGIAGHSVVLQEYAALSMGMWFLGNGAVSYGEWFWDVALSYDEWFWEMALCFMVSGYGMWRC